LIPEPDNSIPDDGEVVDGYPMPADRAPVPEAVPPAGGLVPARQAAALAATGFVAGAATAAVVASRRSRVARKKRKKGVVGEIVGSNSFLVDVHLVRRS
jgi:hypothetical protein